MPRPATVDMLLSGVRSRKNTYVTRQDVADLLNIYRGQGRTRQTQMLTEHLGNLAEQKHGRSGLNGLMADLGSYAELDGD